MEVNHLKEMLAEKTTQNEFLHKQLETAAVEKAMLETFSSNQKLLEYKRGKRRRNGFRDILIYIAY